MVIEAVVTNLRQALASISSGTKKKFLDGFARIHNEWHMAEMTTGVGTFQGSPIGFLSFHHEVVKVYVAKFDPNITPGPMENPSPPYPQSIDAITDPVQFSIAIEGWHNLVHRRIGGKFADPRRNIYMRRFWQFHKFIDEKFQNWLQAHQRNYDDLDHTAV